MLIAVLILGVLGLVFGMGLYIASKVFHVPMDQRVQQVDAALPGSNCGACGHAGCAGFAKAIVHGSADIAACVPGGDAVAQTLSQIMGVATSTKEKQVAVLHCHGKNAKNKYHYNGIDTCKAAVLINNGPKMCAFGCIGFGDCVSVCPFDAITMSDGLPYIDEAKCTGCRKCVMTCPKSLFAMHAMASTVHVLCCSKLSAKDTIKACDVGCIACQKCVNVCKFEAIYIEENRAIIDYDKCVSCGVCEKVCPRHIIVNVRQRRKDIGLWPVKKNK